MAWDVTVLDTYAEFHISQTAREQGAAVIEVSASTTAKYRAYCLSHTSFTMVAAETAGTCGQSATERVQEIGKRVTKSQIPLRYLV